MAGGNYLTELRDGMTDLALDWGRAKFVDVERSDDDRNIPDRNDLRDGHDRQTQKDATGGIWQQAPGGVNLSTWLILAGVAVVGYAIVKKVL